MQQEHYKGYCLTYRHNRWQIQGFANTFYSITCAKEFIDLMSAGVTKANENCKPNKTIYNA
ncbi:MAG: hypothetical protein NTZ59_11680 [Bacteroidetes bacterium]|nr:hypothetical protein [Bacteroidota bacterium]